MDGKGLPPATAGRRLTKDPRLVGNQKESPYKMRCQKCNDTTHWTYDCKKTWQYAHRDSRTAELKKRILEGPDGKIQVIDKPAPVKEENNSSESSSSSDSSSSSSSEEEKRKRKKAKKRKKAAKKSSKKKKSE